jgi:tight adherence protein B
VSTTTAAPSRLRTPRSARLLVSRRGRARARIDGLARAAHAGVPQPLAPTPVPRPDPTTGPAPVAAAAATVGAGVVLVGLSSTAILATGALVGWQWWRRHRRQERARARQGQLPEALERLASALRIGASLPQALAEAGRHSPPPLGPELTELAEATSRGRRLLDVLDTWTAAHDDRGTRLAATALALAARVGAAPARAVDGVAATLRERMEVAADRRALATQARASAVVLSAAPVGVALLLGLTDSAAARFLLRTPQGWACLTVGLGLDLVGAVWMARLTRAGDP